MIQVEQLNKSVTHANGGQQQVLYDINFRIERGEVVSLIGPSGAGKSMLLRCLNLLEHPTSGRILIEDEEVTVPGYPLSKLRQRMGMVFQSFNLFPHLTVLENTVLAPMKLKRMGREEAEALAIQNLRRVGMAEKVKSYPNELSGGQQQRAAIARCLAMQPSIILFDEPTSSLDPTMVSEVQGVIHTLAQEGLTMLITTHEMRFARDISKRVFFLHNGHLLESGTPKEIFDNPQHEETITFVHRIRSLVFEITSRDFDFYDMTSQIRQFCIRCNIPEKMNPIVHIIEEMLLLSPDIEHPVHIEVNQNDLKQHTSIVYLVHDDNISPLERPEVDELSVMIIRGMSQDIKTEHINGNTKLTITIA